MPIKKIAFLVFQVANNLGGIPSSVGQLKLGLEDNGCTVDVFWAEWRDSVRRSYSIARDGIKSIVTDWGLVLHVGADSSARALGGPDISWAYKGHANACKLRDKLSEYDAVICATALPSSGSGKQKGNNDWKTVLQHGRPMLYVIRDCHWLRYAPHLVTVKDLFIALACQHMAGFHSVQNFPGPISYVGYTFDIAKAKNPPKHKERLWVCSAAYFKAWKHMEDGLCAAPFLHPVHLFYLGGGIEKCYMIAKPKSREEYSGHSYASYMNSIMQYWWHKDDKSFKPEFQEKSMWNVAEESGNFTYLGFRHGKVLEEIERLCGGMVDFSWHEGWGEHFNRVTIDAMLHHCLPFARPLGISNNKKGIGEVIGPENVVLIPEDASPKHIAEIIKSSLQDDSLVKEVVNRNLKFIQQFDRAKVAKEYIRLLNGEKAGTYYEEGKPDAKSEKWIKFFSTVRRYPRLGVRFPRLED